LLADVGECLIHPSAADFEALVAAWNLVAATEAVIHPYVQSCISEAQRQRDERHLKEFDVERLDTVIDRAVRGLQPAQLTAAIDRLPAAAQAVRPFLKETHRLLDVTIDLLSEVP
jgi:hypothetical protein